LTNFDLILPFNFVGEIKCQFAPATFCLAMLLPLASYNEILQREKQNDWGREALWACQ